MNADYLDRHAGATNERFRVPEVEQQKREQERVRTMQEQKRRDGETKTVEQPAGKRPDEC